MVSKSNVSTYYGRSIAHFDSRFCRNESGHWDISSDQCRRLPASLWITSAGKPAHVPAFPEKQSTTKIESATLPETAAQSTDWSTYRNSRYSSPASDCSD